MQDPLWLSKAETTQAVQAVKLVQVAHPGEHGVQTPPNSKNPGAQRHFASGRTKILLVAATHFKQVDVPNTFKHWAQLGSEVQLL